MRLRCAIGALAVLTAASLGQTNYRVPFASRGNVVELSVRNVSKLESDRLTVSVKGAPDWLVFSSSVVELDRVTPGVSAPAEFQFSVIPSAPVGHARNVSFDVTDASGARWTKEIAIEVEAPQSFALSECYPNPFNPSTTVAFELPVSTQVWLRVYDLLGREVTSLAQGELPPGRHQRSWSASAVASGTYVLVLEARSAEGSVMRLERKAILTK